MTLRRKIWMLAGVVVLVPLVLWTGAMLVLPMLGKSAYGAGSASSVARYQWAANITPGFLEGWEGPYNLGTAQVAHRRADSGVENLELALTRVRAEERVQGQVVDTDGPECKVRTNLSLGYEKQGDAAGTGGGALFTKATETIQPCTSTKENKEKQKRQRGKKEKLDGPQSPNPGPSSNPSQQPSSDPSQSPNPSQQPSSDPSQSPNPSGSGNPSTGQGSGDPTTLPGEKDDGKEDKLRQINREGAEKGRNYQRRGPNGGTNW